MVTDNSSKGCAEIKPAVSLWDKSITEAVSSSNTFCLNYDVNNTLHLKRKHIYFHQCQLQLFVGRDTFDWCDFVIATKNDMFIQRLILNQN